MYRQEDIRFIQALINSGHLKEADFVFLDQNAQDLRQKYGITRALKMQAGISERVLAETLAKEFHLPLMETIEGETWIEVEGLKREDLIRYRVIPFFIQRKELSVAFADPPYQSVIQFLEKASDKKILPVIVSLSVFEELQEANDQAVRNLPQLEKLRMLVSAINETALHPTEVNLTANVIVEAALEAAYELGASEIHFDVFTDRPPELSFRIAGFLQKTAVLPFNSAAPAASFFRQAAGVAEGAPFAETMVNMTFHGEQIAVLLSLISTQGCEKFILKPRSKRLSLRRLDQLGLSPHDLLLVSQLLSPSAGLTIIAGSSGSGRTTSYYAFLNHLKNLKRAVASIESFVELKIEDIVQISPHQENFSTFTEAVRAAFQNPVNVLGSGSMDGKEEAVLLTQAAAAGIGCVGILTATDTVDALSRFLNYGVARPDAVKSLNGIVAQRFVRRLCPECAAEYRPDVSLLEKAGLRLLPANVLLKRPSGCERCLGTGYLGVMPLFEVLVMTDKLKEMLLNAVAPEEIVAAAQENDFRTFAADGALKSFAGLTSLDEVLRVALTTMQEVTTP